MERWDWERLSENPGLPWCIELMERCSQRLNWASLSSLRHLPWSSGFYEHFQKYWYPALVAVHQDFEICSLSDEQVDQLLIKMQGSRSEFDSQEKALIFGVA